MRTGRLAGPNYLNAKPLFGILVGAVGYLLLSIQSPLRYTIPVWMMLALVVIPALIGVSVGAVTILREGIAAAFWVAAMTMLTYSALNMARIHGELPMSADPGQVFLACAIVSVAYALVAGIVSAGVNALYSRLRGAQA